MEVNLLPISIPSGRPNQELTAYGQRDTYFLNCYFEVYKENQTKTQQVFAIKRPGIGNTNYAVTGTTGIGAGCFTAQNQGANHIYFAISEPTNPTLAKVYHFDGVSTVTYLAAVNTDNAWGTYRVKFFDCGLPGDPTNIGFLTGNGSILYYKGITFTGLTPATKPWDNGKLTTPVYLNNRVFVGIRDSKTNILYGPQVDNSCRIYQSNIADFITFPEDEYQTVESYGGILYELKRYNNFIAAFKEYSIEFFEDVGNTNGTVLARVGNALQQVGCTNPDTIVDTGAGELIWVSNDKAGNHEVAMLTNSFNVEFITTPQLNKYLNLVNVNDASYAFMLNINGRRFYVLTLTGDYPDQSQDAMNCTFVYDLENKLWTSWNSPNSGTQFTLNGLSYTTLGKWRVSGSCINASNVQFVQSLDNGGLYFLDDSNFTDYSQAIPVIIQLSNLDLGTFNRKFINSLTIFADMSTGSYTFDVVLSQTDYGLTGNLRQLKANTTSPYEYTGFAWGSYKRFTLYVKNTDNMPLRISGINVNYDVGDARAIS